MIFISILAISKLMILDFEPGDKVTNPNNKDWGTGQVQSIINGKVTVNFENVGKKVINSKIIQLEKLYKWTLKKKRKLPFHL